MFGRILNFEAEENKVLINFETGNGIIEVLSPSIINVFSPLKYDEHYSKAIENRTVEKCDISVAKHDNHIEIKTEKLTVEVFDDFKVDFYDKIGNILCEDYKGNREPFKRRGNGYELLEKEGHKVDGQNGSNKIEIIKKMLGEEKFYGLGDKTGPLNKKGYGYEMWNTDDPSAHLESHKALYKSIPFFITLRKNSAFGIFYDNTFKSYFDLGKENSNYYYFGSDDGNLDYYFILGPELDKVIAKYTKLTGKTPLPQMWTLGYQQCRWSYSPENRLMEIAKNLRSKDIPCDALYLDIDYMDDYRVFTWNKKAFPKPKEMIENLNKDGFKLVTIIDPGVKKDKGYSIYEEGIKNNYFATDKDGLPYVNAVWPGDSLFPDFSDNKVRNWWGNNVKSLMDIGVSGIWNDMNEPASFNGPLPLDVQFKNDGNPTDHSEIHNVYGHLMAKATYDGIKNSTKKRPFVVTRACYAGTQKYSTGWTGDNQSLWEHLRMSIPMFLNLGMSGLAFNGADVGGFGYDCTAELLCRWNQVGCFTPLFRNHSTAQSRDQEPWAFDDETLNISRKYIKLRYKLIPYLYDLMWECEQSGLPVMRPLLLHYTSDENTHEINDEFLFGPNILVAPILEQGKKFRAVYLPKGEWIDYFTKEKFEGEKFIVKEAPLDICPIYIKAGSIIPNYPDQNYIGEKEIDELTLDVYPGNGEYLHYQDDGESFNYRNGEYNLYKFTTENNNCFSINIESLKSGYRKKYNSFKFIINATNATSIKFNNEFINFTTDGSKIHFSIPAKTGNLKILL